MKVYLVGGAVRDRLLGRPGQDRDYVVVGATPEEMVAAGFKPVGAAFPVFLHPETKEEYALARTERKHGRGYKGFIVYAAPDVTLEQDLARRDLTINAMAMDEAGRLIDPFGGERDLREGVLRHVSPAFAEDPLRVLRVARFAARFPTFRVAPETLDLMRGMSASGELETLTPERVWGETDKALGETAPARYLEVLRECGALSRLFPELDALFGVPQPSEYHPEVDTGIHILLVLAQAARISPDRRVRFAALMHDLGKGTTPREAWPHHVGHEERGAALVETFCRRWRVPNEYRELAVLTARYHGLCHRACELRPATLLELLESLDVVRRPERFESFLLACEADHRGRPGYETRPYPQAEYLRRAAQAVRSVDAAAIAAAAAGSEGAAIAERIRQARLAALRRLEVSAAEPGKTVS
jgi:tRNA nucleotidyltransferase (CCA-adding enzyme)